jgi:double stranded RNA-specific editase B
LNLVDRRGRFRAIYGRIENTIQGLPPPFRLNRPSMYLLTSSETRMPCKAPSFSVIWCTGLPQPEIINTNVGKPEKGRSKFCKYELMERFVRLIGNISSITEIEKNTPGSYSEAKEAVHSVQGTRISQLRRVSTGLFFLQTAKDSLYKAFVKAGLGNWISKPLEQDTFDLILKSDDTNLN